MQKLSLSFLFIGIVGILMAATSFQKSKEDAECIVEAVKTVEKVKRDTVVIRDTVFIAMKRKSKMTVSKPLKDYQTDDFGYGDKVPCSFKFRFTNDLIYLSGEVNELVLNLDSIKVSAPIYSNPDGSIISLSPYVSIRPISYSW